VATVGLAGDLERRVPVDLLDDRASKTLSTWLQSHPSVEIVSRDRPGAYALGACAGAPDAQQVPDRWHILKNIGEVLERVLHQNRPAIEDAVSRDGSVTAEATTAAPALIAADAAEATVLLARPATRSKLAVETSSSAVVWRSYGRRALTVEQVHALHATGLSTRAVTKHLGLSRITVHKYMWAEQSDAASLVMLTDVGCTAVTFERDSRAGPSLSAGNPWRALALPPTVSPRAPAPPWAPPEADAAADRTETG
jgi:hypothetical protein